MASGKRASMREGPLAALFRKTEEDGAPKADAPEQREEVRREPVERRPPPEPARARARTVPVAVRAPQDRLLRGHPREHHGARARPATQPERAPRNEHEPVHLPASPLTRKPVLRVVGVGGAGVNAVDRMIEAQVEGVEFIAVNTDMQSLEESSAPTRVHIGDDVHARPRLGLEPRARPPVGHRAVRRAQEPAQGRGHDLHHRRRRWRHRHGRRARGGADLPRGGRAHRGHRHQAVRLRGRPARRPGRGRDRGAGGRGRHAHHDPELAPALGARQDRRRWSTPSGWPTTCCARACRASRT